MIATLHAHSIEAQKARLFERVVEWPNIEPLARVASVWAGVRCRFAGRGFALLVIRSVAVAVGTLDRPGTEREETREGEMWRLARRTALGNEADLRAAYAAHGAELYRFALRTLGDSGLAEEAVQDTFVRAWRAADRHDPGRGALRTWLFAICRNAVIDLHRARSIRPVTLGQEEGSVRAELADPSNPIEEKMAAWQIEEALRSISEERRHAIVETYYKGRSYKDLSEELGVPEGTLRSRVFYGMKALRRELEEMGWNP